MRTGTSDPLSAPPPVSGIRAWFDLARAGNFPSVASNVVAAAVLSVHVAEGAFDVLSAPEVLALAVLAGCLVYAGGATFNDVFDAGFDAKHRPERVIPRGIVSRPAAGAIAAVEMLLGLGLLVYLGGSPLWAGALAVCILGYDWLHKRWLGSVVLMAGCRVFLAFAVGSIFYRGGAAAAFLCWIAALFVYIVTLSLVARWEYQPGAPAAKLGRAVGRMLAFIPLIDAIALLLVGAWQPAMACAAAVPLGRWAQRLAAAT